MRAVLIILFLLLTQLAWSQDTTQKDTTQKDTTRKDTVPTAQKDSLEQPQRRAAQDTTGPAGVRKDTTGPGAARQDTTGPAAVRQDTGKQDTVKQNTVKQDSVERDTTAKQGVVKKEPAPVRRTKPVFRRAPTGPVLYVNPDTVLSGPPPTDTSRNKINGFVKAFFDGYPTDFDSFSVPARPREERVVPDLDFRPRIKRDGWLLFVLAILITLTTLIIRFFRKDVRELFEGFVSNRLINQIAREPGLLNTPAALLLLILAGLSIGGLLYFIIPHRLLPFPYKGPELYLILAGLAALVYVIRIFLLKIAGFIFGIREFVSSYLYILYTATGTVSFLIIILLLFKLLGPPALAEFSIPAMQIIFLFFFVYQYTRGVWYLVTTFEFPKIYLILYLCAFEICPLLILGKGLFNS